MRRLILALFAIVVVLGFAELGHACSSLGSSVNVETFECAPCDDDPKAVQLPIFVLSGQLQLTNRRSAPTLGSIVADFGSDSAAGRPRSGFRVCQDRRSRIR